MKITVDTSELLKLQQRISDIGRNQIPFATALALTRTAKDVKDAMPAVLDRVIDRPTPFTRRGIFTKGATKSSLEATVGFMDIQAGYLRPLIVGSARNEKPIEQKFLGRYFVPTKYLPTNTYGNVAKATIVALVRAAVSASTWQGRRVVVLTSGRGKRPAGVYLAGAPTSKGKKAYAGAGMMPLLFFTRQPRYRQVLRFRDEVENVVSRVWPFEFAAAYQQAVASAR